jgi:hypothetical protein
MGGILKSLEHKKCRREEFEQDTDEVEYKVSA